MTRINLVDPSLLTNKHLMGEYHELPRIFTSIRKLYESGKTIKDVSIPEQYVLGQGHMKFFYNKLTWLAFRYSCIKIELERRDYSLDIDKFESIRSNAYEFMSDHAETCIKYRPSPEEIYLNMSRLCKRSNIPEVLNEMASA